MLLLSCLSLGLLLLLCQPFLSCQLRFLFADFAWHGLLEALSGRSMVLVAFLLYVLFASDLAVVNDVVTL